MRLYDYRPFGDSLKPIREMQNGIGINSRCGCNDVFPDYFSRPPFPYFYHFFKRSRNGRKKENRRNKWFHVFLSCFLIAEFIAKFWFLLSRKDEKIRGMIFTNFEDDTKIFLLFYYCIKYYLRNFFFISKAKIFEKDCVRIFTVPHVKFIQLIWSSRINSIAFKYGLLHVF